MRYPSPAWRTCLEDTTRSASPSLPIGRLMYASSTRNHRDHPTASAAFVPLTSCRSRRVHVSSALMWTEETPVGVPRSASVVLCWLHMCLRYVWSCTRVINLSLNYYWFSDTLAERSPRWGLQKCHASCVNAGICCHEFDPLLRRKEVLLLSPSARPASTTNTR